MSLQNLRIQGAVHGHRGPRETRPDPVPHGQRPKEPDPPSHGGRREWHAGRN